MGLLMRLMRKLFHRLSRHKPRRDEDLQGRPARPEAEAVRARVAEVMVGHYADRTKGGPTRRRFRHRGWGRRGSYMRSKWPARGCFGNPRWMRGEGVTPYGISSRAPARMDQT